MKIIRRQVLNITKYKKINQDFIFPFKIICTDFNKEDKFFEVNCLDIEYDFIYNNKLMINFMLTEKLENLNQETIELMTKGFFDRIEHVNILDRISNLAIEYKKNWKEYLCESENIEEYGLNEFLGGKADAYEDCVQIIKEHLLTNQ